MGSRSVIECDVCKRQKGEANKWFSLSGWRPVAFNEKAKRHLCSEDCAHRMLARELQKVREGEKR